MFTLFIFVVFSALLLPKPVSANTGFLSFINSLFPQTIQTEKVTLNNEDLAKLIQPSIVRIIRETKGSVILHTNFAVDIRNLKILSKPLLKPVTFPVDEKMSGTGFMITPEGHIMTNSHVVSSQDVINSEVSQLKSILVKSNLNTFSNSEMAAFIDNSSSTEASKINKQFGKDIEDALLKDLTLEATTTITVLNPASKVDNLNDFIKDGFPATIISVNDNFNKDQKDVAIIKINQDNLPSIQVSNNVSTTSLVTGQKIFAFGFPGSADVNINLGHDFVEPTFTSGTISALKSSDNGDFKIIQTDAKISSGSSGSPALDEKGNVIGIMTYTSGDTGSSGDTFAFALPIEVIKPIFSDAHVEPGSGPLYKHFILGLNLFSEKHCEQAISEFQAAKNINSEFSTDMSFIDTYINQCKALQVSGQSLDTDWQQFLQNVKPYEMWALVAIFLVILIFIVILVIVIFSRKMKKEEEEMAALRARSQIPPVGFSDMTPAAVVPIQTPAPVIEEKIEKKPENIISSLQNRTDYVVDFIKKQKVENKNLGLVVVALRNEGYSDSEIQEGFNIVNKANL